MFGVFYPGQMYPAQSPEYPAVIYNPTYRYRAVVPYESRTVAVKRENRVIVVPHDTRSADMED